MNGAAAGAAAAAIMRQRHEEEEMTTYDKTDLSEGWEFKILRSSTAAFRRPERLRQILQQEGQAGWELVEKFDNGRVRLKRPVTARSRDSSLDFDPYRTYVGMSETMLALLIAGCVLGGIMLVVILVRLSR